MLRIIPILIVLVFCSDLSFAQTAILEWVFSQGDSSQDVGNALVLTKNEDLIITGYFDGTVDFDPDTSVKYLNSTNGPDLFIQKLNTNGRLIWVKQLVSNGFVGSRDIIEDDKGNIIICGRFFGTVDFDPDTSVYSITSTGITSESYILKLDSNGNFIWVAYFKGNGDNHVSLLSVDLKGNITGAGVFDHTVDFDPDTSTYNLTTNNTSTIFLVKLDSSGKFLWAKKANSNNFDFIFGMAKDKDDNIYITGSFSDTTDFDLGTNTHNLISKGIIDIFLVKYDDSGGLIWAHSFGSSNSCQGNDLTLDSNGNIYVVGSIRETVDFDPSSATNSITAKSNTVSSFILKFNTAGNFVWVKGTNGSFGAGGGNVCLDANENVYVAGSFRGWHDFDPDSSVAILNSAGSDDIYLQSLDSNGKFRWARSIGGKSYDYISGFAINNKQELLFNGVFSDSVDFDPSKGIVRLISVNKTVDNFVQKLSQCNPTYLLDSIIACDSYVWIDGITYKADNNTALFTISGGSKGVCDTIAKLQLQINYSSIQFDTITTCDSFKWRDGKTYTQSINKAKYTIDKAAINGCDSIYYLVLTINKPISVTDTIIGCDSIRWIDGITYYSSTNTPSYTYIAGGSNGCDSIIHLNLKLYKTLHNYDTISVCDSLIWVDNKTYKYSTNTASFSYSKMVNGVCDSIIHLRLTVNQSKYSHDSVTACDSFTWKNGITYKKSTSAETFNYSGGAVNGCDSVLHLKLTILNSTSSIDTIVACSSHLWLNGKTYTTSNYKDTYLIPSGASNGCDSSVNLNLTINYPVIYYDTIKTCDSFEWINGLNYTVSSDSLIFTYPAGAFSGCDSTIILNLTINQPSHSVDTVYACDKFTWLDGKTYTKSEDSSTFIISSGSFTGCDSIIHLKLKINNTVHYYDTIQSCDSFKWINGITYMSSIDTIKYNIIGGASTGCDSIIHLNLKINHSIETYDTIITCDSFIWLDNINYKNSSHSLTYIFKNGTQNGCDSIVNLNLIINKTNSSTDSIIACKFYKWIDGKTYYASVDTVSYRYKSGSIKSCDSIVHLFLTINNVNSISVTKTDSSLMADNSNAQYQWLDCDNNFALISGENKREFVVLNSGIYAVELYENQCLDTSTCIELKLSGITSKVITPKWKLYPNPNNGEFNIRFDKGLSEGILSIYDIRGSLKQTITNDGLNEMKIKISLTPGVYSVSYNTKYHISNQVMIVY